jgi:ribonuclease HIII
LTIVFKVSDNVKNKIIEYYKDLRRDKTPPYAIFQAEEADTIITLYESGKIMFQGTSADIDANIWIDLERRLNGRDINIDGGETKVKPKDESIMDFNTIGSDEVGTGDFFGPIVVTASYVDKSNFDFLFNLGVRDSKKLTDEKIKQIAPEIMNKIPYVTTILDNKTYNEKHSTNLNMNKLKAILHNKALGLLKSKITNYDYIVVDQFAEKYVYYNYLKESNNVVRNITFITKAEDKCLAVACASCISRYKFLKEFGKISKELNTLIPKGASDRVDEVALKIVKEKGIDILDNYVKKNFKNYEKLKETK